METPDVAPTNDVPAPVLVAEWADRGEVVSAGVSVVEIAEGVDDSEGRSGHGPAEAIVRGRDGIVDGDRVDRIAMKMDVIGVSAEGGHDRPETRGEGPSVGDSSEMVGYPVKRSSLMRGRAREEKDAKLYSVTAGRNRNRCANGGPMSGNWY